MIFNWLIEQKIARLKQHLARKIEAATVMLDPFPHVVVDEVFPDWYFERAQQFLIEPSYFPLTGGDGFGFMRIEDDDPHFSLLGIEQRSYWRHLDAIVKPALFEALSKRFAAHASTKLGLMLDGEVPNIDLANSEPTRGIIQCRTGKLAQPPRVDKATSLFTYFLQFSRGPSLEQFGEALYEVEHKDALISAYKERAEVRLWVPDIRQFGIQRSKTIEYRPNRLLAFINFPYSLHSVDGDATPGRISIQNYCELPQEGQALFSNWTDALNGGQKYTGSL